jgi:hypothetical protein
MLTDIQCRILSACTEEYELFYFLYSAANRDLRLADQLNPATAHSGSELAGEVWRLIWIGLLEVQQITPEQVRIKIEKPAKEEFRVYEDYDCKTIEDHWEKFGYGPHEFRTTAAGLGELRETE